MPELGEIRLARELGIRDTYKYIWQACADCGKERWVQLIRNKPKYKLCLQCAIKKRKQSFPNRSGSNNSHWRGGKVRKICLNCEEEFYIYPGKQDDGRTKFCSHSCIMIYQRKQGIFSSKPNKPEQILINLFEKDNLPFKYVGAGEVWFGNRNPDFINTNGAKQVIELLGTYWHPLFDGANRIEHYKQYGFDCLIIWEDELEDTKKIIKKVEKFIKF